eukprot:2947028-Rhodomonas_salina.1
MVTHFPVFHPRRTSVLTSFGTDGILKGQDDENGGAQVGRFKDRDAERKKKREAYEEKRRKYNAKAKK